MYKACSRCNRIHSTTYNCNHLREKKPTKASSLRQLSAWHSKSSEIRKRSNYLCEVCREEGTYNYKNLEVHHITSIEEDKDRLLDNYNLICLCQEHHKEAEAGKIDRDYLYELARRREDS